MNEALQLALAGTGGAALGIFFFAGLWYTIRKAVFSPHPALWFSGSVLARIGLTLAGFYFIAGGRRDRLLVCLLGFAFARGGVTWLTRTPPNAKSLPRGGAHHAP